MSFGVKLPIRYSSINGFASLNSFAETIKQNFKMLLLTAPGERVMVPEYGVGVRNYLFANYGMGMEEKLRDKILEQVSIYLPIVIINDILIDNSNIDSNSLGIMIYYSIPDLGVQDLLEFTI
jgi:phage baseplate assembly protein W